MRAFRSKDIAPIQRGACDCHIHVFDRRFPLPGHDPSQTPDAPASRYREVQKALGLERAILVQANGYGADNRCMLEAIDELGRDRTRAIAVVSPDASLRELSALGQRGVCGIRFHMLPGGYLTWAALDGLSRRAAEVGWHIQLQMDGRDLADRVDQLQALPCRLVIDHIGKFLEPVTVDHPGFQALLRLVNTGNTWIKLSAAYEVSRIGPPNYEDVGVLATALVRSAPERMLWASNWPHPWRDTSPDDQELLDLLSCWTPNIETRDRILVDNPSQLYFGCSLNAPNRSPTSIG